MLIDSHAHLTATEFDADRKEVLERAAAAQIEKIINICTTPSELEKGLELLPTYPWVAHAAATPPHTVAETAEKDFEFFASHARSGTLVAIGESGLDYHFHRKSAALQKKWFRQYLTLAEQCSLPIVVHCREAFEDLFAIIDEYPTVKGVSHCFTGNHAEAKELTARGWYLSFSGIITFKKSEDLRAIAKEVPQDLLLIETDAPYLAPHPYRSQRNEPSYLVETARLLAHLKGIPLEELAHATTHNAHQLFSV